MPRPVVDPKDVPNGSEDGVEDTEQTDKDKDGVEETLESQPESGQVPGDTTCVVEDTDAARDDDQEDMSDAKPGTSGVIVTVTEEGSQEDEDSVDDDEIIGGSSQVGRKSMTGQTCSLKTLIDDQVLVPGERILHMEYMGQKFTGDLLPNGHIRWSETKQVFSTPSSWVNHSKKLVNPDNSGKAGSAWSTIRYKGKRLDSYKLRWYRRQKKIVTTANFMDGKEGNSVVSQTNSTSSTPCPTATAVASNLFSSQGNRLSTEDPDQLRRMNVVDHSSLLPRNSGCQDSSVLVKTTAFASMERIQPFTMSISTNALLLIDFHCHLTSGEVTGYLAGTWDFASHVLAIVQAFPCRSRLGDKERSLVIEEEIKQNLEQRSLSVVGWYHSHPVTPPHPSVKDIENQLDYQIALKGESEATYLPCIALICSPYDSSNESPESSYQCFWVMPPPEYRPQEYGRPMQMMFSVTRDSFLTQDLLLEMVSLFFIYFISYNYSPHLYLPRVISC